MRQRKTSSGRASVRLGPLVGTLCLTPLLSGCWFATDRPELGIEIPETYRAASRNPERALPPLDWWANFRSRELTALVEEAQMANYDIAAAVARIVQADAQARISGATLLPTVDANASVTRSKPANAAGTTGTGIGASTRNIYDANLSAAYEIDFWGKNRATLLAAEQTAVATRFDRDTVAITTMASVANTYFLILSTQDRLRVGHNNVAAAERILALIRQRFDVGTASQLDIAQQETLVAQQRVTIPGFEETLRQNIALLAVLVGRTPESFRVPPNGLSSLTAPRVTPGLPSSLLNIRPDIRAAEARLTAANYSVEAARAAFFPTVQLTGLTGYQSLALARLFTPGNWYYTLAAAATQPVFDGFLHQGQLELQQGVLQENLQIYRKAVLAAFSDVENALVAYQKESERERLQSRAVAAARQAFQLSEQRLREGTVDLVTVLNTQQTLFQAQDALIQIQLARFQALVSIYQALGGGWPPREHAEQAAVQ
jgi:NodT family efflux transporter outer membrane factor (OMF) lipoprotein